LGNQEKNEGENKSITFASESHAMARFRLLCVATFGILVLLALCSGRADERYIPRAANIHGNPNVLCLRGGFGPGSGPTAQWKETSPVRSSRRKLPRDDSTSNGVLYACSFSLSFENAYESLTR
jgi:hypothetical protein